MRKKIIFFNDILKNTADILSKLSFKEAPLIIRDIYGRIRLAFDREGKDIREYEEAIVKEWSNLGSYGEHEGKKVLSRDDFFDPDSIFKSADILDYQVPETGNTIRILDRPITGQDWTRLASSDITRIGGTSRLVFYGLKGGVGRSTAMAILAYHLAKKGKDVLLIDFDLESPGLSGLMLPPDRMAEFGIVDWFVEDAIGQGNEILPAMMSICPLSQAEGVTGKIHVAAASGMNEPAYLAKLSRVYADIPGKEGGIERFPERMVRLVKALEEQVKPDVILIDSRAGLHDLAAVSVVGLGTKTFLFAVNSAQTWQGYRLLFSHWQFYPAIAIKVREHLKIVGTLFPETNQESHARSFLEHSYDLFSSTLYDEIPPGSDSLSPDVFNFDIGDPEAPHYPLRIKWNARFQEFSVNLLSEKILTHADIEAAYGDFLSGAELLIEEEYL
ncbi:MAG: AAA family ATPase [bacterium]